MGHKEVKSLMAVAIAAMIAAAPLTSCKSSKSESGAQVHAENAVDGVTAGVSNWA